jgi:hypothetical protein
LIDEFGHVLELPMECDNVQQPSKARAIPCFRAIFGGIGICYRNDSHEYLSQFRLPLAPTAGNCRSGFLTHNRK